MNIVGRNQASGFAGNGEVMPFDNVNTPSETRKSPRALGDWETREKYSGELCRDGRFRVVICREGLQWLFQQQRLKFASAGKAWDTLGYCRTRKALIRLSRAHNGALGVFLSTLPEYFSEGGEV